MINFDFNKFLESPDLKKINAGVINSPSGNICICNPFSNPALSPLSRTVKPGKYPVEIYQTNTSHNAFAVLRFSQEEVVSWEDTILPDNTERIFFVPNLDGKGILAFLDDETKELYIDLDLEKIMGNPEFTNYPENILSDYIKPGILFFEHKPDPSSDLNALVFIGGDGHGSSYWGLNQNNDPVCLLVDLQVVE